MQNLNFLETEFLDILFRERNKNYGAYTLRKYYPQRIRNAMLIMLASVCSFIVLHFSMSKTPIPPLDAPVVVTNIPDLTIDKILQPETKAQVPPPLSKPQANPDIPTKVVQTSTPADPVQKPIKPEISSGVPGGTGDPDLPGGSEGGTDPASGPPRTTVAPVVTPPAPNPHAPVPIAQKMPQFPGGEDALLQYLQDHIKYPTMARKVGVQGTVYVEFVVNTVGKISDIKILKGIGYGCDKETMRVIRSMPVWEPGENNGSKVSVSYTIPVSFEM